MRRSLSATRIAFAGLIISELIVVFYLRYLVLTDGVFHDSVSAMYRDLIQGHGALVASYYNWRLLPTPNLVADGLLTGLMLIFSPNVAEKILVAGYIVILPLSFVYALRALNRKNMRLAFLILPFTFSFAFDFGFYDFAYSIIFFFAVAGYTLRVRGVLTSRRALVLSALLVATYFAHLVGCLEALLFVGIVLGVDLLDGSDGKRVARALKLGLALAPASILVTWFVIATGTGSDPIYQLRESRYRAIAELFTFSWELTSYSVYEEILALILAVAVLVLCVAAARDRTLRLRSTDSVLLFVFASSVAFCVAPESVGSGGSFLTQRLALFPAFGLFLWLGGRNVPRGLLVVGAIVSSTVAVGLFAVRWPYYSKLDRIATDYMSVGSCLAHGSTLLQANMAPAMTGALFRVDGMLSDESGLLASESRDVDLGSAEGSVPYFLLKYRSALEPNRYLVWPYDPNAMLHSTISRSPPRLDPLGYSRRTGGQGTVDYLIVFGLNHASAADLRSPLWRAFARELHAGYRLVAKSPNGWADAWERRGSPAATEGARLRAGSSSPACIHPSSPERKATASPPIPPAR